MHLQPVARKALLAAFHSPDHQLRRTPAGFTTPPTGADGTQVFTRRAVNWLDDAGLVEFDDPGAPSLVRLNARGERYAEQLLADAHQAARA